MSKPKFKIGDRVRILDGSEIDDYTGGFPSDMARLVGKIATVRSVEPCPGGRIAYLLEGVKNVGGYYFWDERGLEKALRTKDGADQKIVVYRIGQSVLAKDYSTGRIAEAKCSPEDEFDFHKGAALALDRLIDREEPEEPKPEEPKYFTGDVVCVYSDFGWWTVGRVYPVENGVIVDNAGDPRTDVLSIEQLNRRLSDDEAKVTFVPFRGVAPREFK